MPQWEKTSLMAGAPPEARARRQLERQDALLESWRAQEAAWHCQQHHSQRPGCRKAPGGPVCMGRVQ